MEERSWRDCGSEFHSLGAVAQNAFPPSNWREAELDFFFFFTETEHGVVRSLLLHVVIVGNRMDSQASFIVKALKTALSLQSLELRSELGVIAQRSPCGYDFALGFSGFTNFDNKGTWK